VTSKPRYMPTIFSAFGLPPPARVVEGLSLKIGLALMRHSDTIGIQFNSHAKTNPDGSGIQRIPVTEYFSDGNIDRVRRREEPLTRRREGQVEARIFSRVAHERSGECLFFLFPFDKRRRLSTARTCPERESCRRPVS
jgi:hypothetical protein